MTTHFLSLNSRRRRILPHFPLLLYDFLRDKHSSKAITYILPVSKNHKSAYKLTVSIVATAVDFSF